MWERFKNIMTEDLVIEITNITISVEKPLIGIAIGIIIGVIAIYFINKIF